MADIDKERAAFEAWADEHEMSRWVKTRNAYFIVWQAARASLPPETTQGHQAELRGCDSPSSSDLRASAEALLAAGHEFWEACQREAGGGAIRWLDATDGTLVIFTRCEYRDALLSRIRQDYAAPVVVFSDPGDEEGSPGITALEAGPAPTDAEGETNA